MVFGMQPYFDRNRKTTSKKNGRQPQKNGRRPKKNERRPLTKNGRRPNKNQP
jgi:hypothetical protein